MNGFPWLSALTVVPVIGAVAVLCTGGNKSAARWTAVCFSAISLAMTLLLCSHFNAASGAMQFEERRQWVAMLGAEYRLGIDGLGLLMLLLSAVVTPIGMAASWKIEERVPLYYALVLLLQSCLFGTFTALNFFHWFIYWELGLIPAYFLVRIWGGEKRAAAAMQFLVYTMVGSVAMLLAFLALFLTAHTFDLTALAAQAQNGQLMPAVVANLSGHRFLPHHIAMLIFAGAFLGFAVKVPLVPFHTWLPAAYSEAPTGTTILLTGAMSKMGVYGFLRILVPIFGAQMQRVLTPLQVMAVATIIFSAYAALAQKDLKRIFAYSSINHLGYCMLGLFAALRLTGDATLLTQRYAAMDGVLLQMFNHGLTAATVFWFIAMLEQRSGGLRGVNDFGGLRKTMPVMAGLMGIALFSSLGLPGLNGFPGEFLIFKGAFPLAMGATAWSVIGLLVTAIFILGVIQRVFAGPLNERWAAMPDMTTAERWAVAPAIVLMFVLGLYPQLLVGMVNGTAMQWVQQVVR